MQDQTDVELLQQYAEQNSEDAFGILVKRYLNLVYSAAWRATGNAHAAEEVTQAVFVILAKKAANFGKSTFLPGWLYQTTRLTASTFLRGEARRFRREQEAYMQALAKDSESETWREIAPLLENAMGELGENERNAVVLRFFQGQAFQEIGIAFGISENAAKKRVDRAVDKLHRYFCRHGISSSTTALAIVLSAHSVQAAPEALAKSLTAVAVGKGSLAGSSTLTLIKGALKVMAWTKAKIAILAGAGLLLAAGTTSITVYEARNHSDPADGIFVADFNALITAPPMLVLRPTKFPSWSSAEQAYNGNLRARHYALPWIISQAYDVPKSQIILPTDLPKGNFDLLLTLRGPDKKRALQDELTRRFGLVAHREMRETDVLVLTLKNPDAPGLIRSTGGNSGSTFNSGKVVIQNERIDLLVQFLEGSLGGGKKIINHSGLPRRYDATLEWEPIPNDPEAEKKALEKALLDQLGFELVPSREPLEMLVLTKAG